MSALNLRLLQTAAGLLAVVLSVVAQRPAMACGAKSDCRLDTAAGERIYRIEMPPGHDGKTPVGAIVFMHGYTGTAAGTMNNRALVKVAHRFGLAFVAPKSFGKDWDIPNSPHKGDRVELEYFDRLLDTLVARHAIDPERIIASGFSAGGMMVWNLACERGERFAGFVPFSGTFWAPVPPSCPSPAAHIIHVHGTADRVVPLAGRPIGPTRQGDVRRAIAMYAKNGGYAHREVIEAGGLTCERRTNAAGKILELCLHRLAHTMRARHLMRALRELKAAGAVN